MARAAPNAFSPYSPGLSVGQWIFVAGQGGINPETSELVGDGIAEQTEQTLRNIEALLQAAGASLDDVVSCLVHLTDLSDFPEFNAAYAARFLSETKPVRTTVHADLLANMRVEITAIAYRAR